ETEWGYLHGSLALLSWGLLNGLFLALLARPAMASTLALTVVAAVITASLFKFEILWMGLSFFDVLIIDPDTISYLLAIVPHARLTVLVSLLIAVPLLITIWRLDPFRVRRLSAALAAAACVLALGMLSTLAPQEVWETFQGVNHTSNFF